MRPDDEALSALMGDLCISLQVACATAEEVQVQAEAQTSLLPAFSCLPRAISCKLVCTRLAYYLSNML